MRLHLRAHKLWRSLLRGRTYPVIEDLDAADFAEFEPKSVLLDFTKGLGAPMIARLGAELREECGLESTIAQITEVPSESLLARLTDQYPAILAHRAPVEVKAEFFGAGGCKTLFRGLLLPFSADGATIDYIYGVTSWQRLGEDDIDMVLAGQSEKTRPPVPPLPSVPLILPGEPAPKRDAANYGWKDPFATPDAADAPSEDASEITDRSNDESGEDVPASPEIPSEEASGTLDGSADAVGEALPESADTATGSPDGEASAPAPTEVAQEEPASPSADGPPAVAVQADAPEPTPIIRDEVADESPAAADPLPAAGLGERLLLARQSVAAACESDVRTRAALYQALARAYDFTIAAEADKAGYAALLAHAGVRAQARAPMTPATKLVFGTHYDKKRLSEFAAVLSHAHRYQVPQGGLDAFLEVAAGGIKGIVAAERALRRPAAMPDVFDQIAEQLRHRWPLAQVALPAQGGEFVLLLARVAESNSLDIIARIDDDAALIQRVGRKAIAQGTKAGSSGSEAA